jgi:small subunit ribosomal protein S1
VWVDKVDKKRNQLMVTMIEPLNVEWRDLKEGQVYTGTISRLESYGAFVNIGAEREGLVHISELSHDYVKQPSEVVKVGDEVQVQVLGFSKRKRRIDLSVKSLLEKPEAQAAAAPMVYKQEIEEDSEEQEDSMPTAMEIALRRAMGDDFPSDRQSKRTRSRRQQRERERAKQEELLNRTLYNN